MTKKKQVELAARAAELETRLNEAAKTYLTALMAIQRDQGLTEMDDTKRVVTTEEGGVYALQFQYFCGPKIGLTKKDPK